MRHKDLKYVACILLHCATGNSGRSIALHLLRHLFGTSTRTTLYEKISYHLPKKRTRYFDSANEKTTRHEGYFVYSATLTS